MKVNISNYKSHKVIKKRKEEVRIDEWDTFSLDHTLALIIYPALVKFKEARKKMPGVSSPFFEYGDELDEHGHHTRKALNIAEKRYIKFINECIWAFGEIARNNPGEKKFFKKNGKKRKTKKLENGGSEIIETGLDFDKEGHTKYYKRLEAATEAFGKNFQTFWW